MGNTRIITPTVQDIINYIKHEREEMDYHYGRAEMEGEKIVNAACSQTLLNVLDWIESKRRAEDDWIGYDAATDTYRSKVPEPKPEHNTPPPQWSTPGSLGDY